VEVFVAQDSVVGHLPITAASSTGRRNTSSQCLSGGIQRRRKVPVVDKRITSGYAVIRPEFGLRFSSQSEFQASPSQVGSESFSKETSVRWLWRRRRPAKPRCRILGHINV
jgi:hypothetical protein